MNLKRQLEKGVTMGLEKGSAVVVHYSEPAVKPVMDRDEG
jgi:hypothetical protein